MQPEQFEQYRKKVTYYVNSGKFMRDDSIEKLIQQLVKLTDKQRTILKTEINDTAFGTSQTTPTSYPWYSLAALQYGTEALKRACIVGTLVSIASYSATSGAIVYSALKHGLFAGTTTFIGSVLYDQATVPHSQLKRAFLFIEELKKLEPSMDSYSSHVSPGIFFAK